VNFITGIIFGIIISTIGLTTVAKWVDKSVTSFRHEVVKQQVNGE
jgi:hypothetical protein